MKKVLVLGASGMAGHVIMTHLGKFDIFEILGTTHRNTGIGKTVKLDLHDTQKLTHLIFNFQPDIIVNCTGVLIRGSQENSAEAVFINSYIPHLIKHTVSQTEARLFQLSTDCVFSGEKGDYHDFEKKDASDIYGMSKSLGEIIDDKNLTIRTSIIGPELKGDGEGLFDWFLKQRGTVKGYTGAYWSGITTIELAKFIKLAIDNNLSGLYQISNGKKISKYNLLQLIKDKFHKEDIELVEYHHKSIDKSLIPSSNFNQIYLPDYDVMVEELYKYVNEKNALYNYLLNSRVL